MTRCFRDSTGIAVATGSISLLGASAITTTGDIAPGVALTSSKSNVVVDGQGARIPIQTSGMESPGAASAKGSGTIVLRGVDITTSGVAAFGVLAQSATTVQAENSTIVTTGPGSVGVEAIDGGNVTLAGGSVTTLMRGRKAFPLAGPAARSWPMARP
ncbi:hypothetical protein [Cupriavidus pauculus]|uniref:Autotransporter outer membrane beta-barrel domain-containing protein n=1 Tax=Cupriavidus pauculus TaxID=82633 RepID=A0A2N5CJE6_9BURK|nr:hypothetical protein [Cupriavidus pauculus]PLQ02343.1 hypothetical protein CYJ10_03350 [Cupriavidus pauculus]